MPGFVRLAGMSRLSAVAVAGTVTVAVAGSGTGRGGCRRHEYKASGADSGEDRSNARTWRG
ncbi:hypothetical protein GCM10009688_23120 [Arthrobacter gandavensis]|uniref:Uncharacterized protein n=1 Tax=Arthrobacter gandavensis TaxID=169960 RepID=A0ABP5ALS5_9MICC